MAQLKILLVTSKFPRFENDPQPRFVFDLALELVKLGHKVVVVAPHALGAKVHETMEGIEVYRFRYFWPDSSEQFAYGAGIPANVQGISMARLQAPFFAFFETIKTLWISMGYKPDIIHVHWGFPQGIGALLSGRPYIMTLYGGEIFMSRKFRMRWLLDHLIKKSQKSFALTNGLKDIAREYGLSSQIDVMPLGVDTDKFRPDIDGSDIRKRYCDDDGLLVISVGRLVEKKGHKYLIDAFADVLKQIPKARLLIVGNGPLLQELTDQVSMLNIGASIIFAKELDHSELPKYYCASDLFVLPSVIDSAGDRETQGVVYLEAMASGLPVIGTDTGGIPDVIVSKEVGSLVREKDSSALSQEITRLLLDGSERKRIGTAAHDYCLKHFVWKEIAKRYEAEYLSAIQRK
jgi:glycosyltransferase involved in cell wall biosynthesis